MRVLVTGASGFVGRRLCARLAACGDTVISRDRELDVVDAARLREVVRAERPGAIVHLAALSSVADCERQPADAFRVNLLGSLAVLRAASERAPDARVLLVTSGAIYGSAARADAGFDETAALRPASAYARSKAAADRLGALFAERGLAVVRARPFNHTGAGRPETFVEARLARDVVQIAARRRPPRLELPNATSRRSFLHVDDVVDAYVALLEPRVPPGAYNVAGDESVTLGELAQRLCRIAGVAAEIEAAADPLRAPDASVGLAERIRAATGWRPRRSLDDALRELLAEQRDKLP
jgi:GDP-4-dehydro-6-deoxy-D-mannose reductase